MRMVYVTALWQLTDKLPLPKLLQAYGAGACLHHQHVSELQSADLAMLYHSLLPAAHGDFGKSMPTSLLYAHAK